MYQVVPHRIEDWVFLPKHDVAVGVAHRIPSRARKWLNDGVVKGSWIVLEGVTPLAAVEPEEGAH